METVKGWSKMSEYLYNQYKGRVEAIERLEEMVRVALKAEGISARHAEESLHELRSLRIMARAEYGYAIDSLDRE